MTIVKLGYVAMSVHLENCSPSQTMTYAQFSKIKDKQAALSKLEKIALSNLDNCLRLLKHNLGNEISFFRFSSKLIPLAGHEDLAGWKYIRPLKGKLKEIGEFIDKHPMRVDFHPDHFVVFTSNKPDILNNSIKTLSIHEALLRGMGVDREHRCVIHVGGAYENKEQALEQFIINWGFVPTRIQEMIMLENDDTTFTLHDTLYLCEKLSIPLVFDYHHHLANFEYESWEEEWERIIRTWEYSKLPVKMHISSPRGDKEKDFRAHADYIDPAMFMEFLTSIKGSVDEIHCMIEAKQKDDALFKLMSELKSMENIEIIDGASFKIH